MADAYVRVSIIGTAPRGDDDEPKVTLDLFNRMVSRAKNIIKNEFTLQKENVLLVSGGAACSGQVFSFFVCFIPFAYALMLLFFPIAYRPRRSRVVSKSRLSCSRTPSSMQMEASEARG